jgi:hypothetical protein
LDLEGFTEFTDELRTLGWIQEERREHRWRGPSGSIIDLLPAGPKLRQARRITWPKSDFENEPRRFRPCLCPGVGVHIR